MPIPLFLVDAFAESPFTGNPAGVCLLSKPADAAWMQHVAAEVNAAETAFVSQRGGDFDLRWFSPTVEIDLCGHATLATCRVLADEGRVAPGASFRFHTKSGALHCRVDGGSIEMDFPAEPAAACPPHPGLLDALGVASPLFVGRNRMDWILEVASPEAVSAAAPDMRKLRAVGGRGVIVTARGAGDADFVSHFFAPAVGVDEDPATGSSHCCLGPYWAAKLGRRDLVGRQLSARRGLIRVRTLESRVMLGGAAFTVFAGALAV